MKLWPTTGYRETVIGGVIGARGADRPRLPASFTPLEALLSLYRVPLYVYPCWQKIIPTRGSLSLFSFLLHCFVSLFLKFIILAVFDPVTEEGRIDYDGTFWKSFFNIYISQCFNFFVMSPFHIIKHWNRIRSIRKEFFFLPLVLFFVAYFGSRILASLTAITGRASESEVYAFVVVRFLPF